MVSGAKKGPTLLCCGAQQYGTSMFMEAGVFGFRICPAIRHVADDLRAALPAEYRNQIEILLMIRASRST